MLLSNFLLLLIAAAEYCSCGVHWSCGLPDEDACESFCHFCITDDKCSSHPCGYLEKCERDCLPVIDNSVSDHEGNYGKRSIPSRGFAALFFKLHPFFSRSSLPTSAVRARRIGGGEFGSEFLGKRSDTTLEKPEKEFLEPWQEEYLVKQKLEEALKSGKRTLDTPQRFEKFGIISKVFRDNDTNQKNIGEGIRKTEGWELLGKRNRELLGKRGDEFLGKRSDELLGKRSELLGKREDEFSGKGGDELLGKRNSEFLGKRSSEFLGKRSSEFLGKKRNEFLGKRNSEFLGKRSNEFLGKRGKPLRKADVNSKSRYSVKWYPGEFLGKRFDPSWESFGEPEYPNFVKNVSDAEELLA